MDSEALRVHHRSLTTAGAVEDHAMGTPLRRLTSASALGVYGWFTSGTTSVSRSQVAVAVEDVDTVRVHPGMTNVMDVRFQVIEWPSAAYVSGAPGETSGLTGARVSPTTNEGAYVGGTGASSHRLERSTDSGSSWPTISGGIIDATTWRDSTAVAGTEYLYRVVAVNGSGEAMERSSRSRPSQIRHPSGGRTWAPLPRPAQKSASALMSP